MNPLVLQMMRELKGFLLAGAIKAYPAAVVHQPNPPSSAEITVHLFLSSQAYLHQAGKNDEQAANFLMNLLHVLAKDEDYYTELAERMAELSAHDVLVWPGFSLRRKRQPKAATAFDLTPADFRYLRSLRISWNGASVA